MTEKTTAFTNGMIFGGVSAELREGCDRVTAGTVVSVGERPEPGDQVIDCRGWPGRWAAGSPWCGIRVAERDARLAL